MIKSKLLIIYIITSFCYSQESYNTELVGNWFEPNENYYWSDNISDFNELPIIKNDSGFISK